MSAKLYVYYIICLIINLISVQNNEIIIPFFSKLSELPKNLTPSKFIEALTYNNLYTKVSIGTPSQNLNFLINFNDYDTYIIHDNEYNNFSSSTFNKERKEGYYYSSDYSYAYFASDKITLGNNISDFNLSFFYVEKGKKEPFISSTGIIGFGIGQMRNFNFKRSFIDQLKQKQLIKNYQFTLIFNDNDFDGKIILEKNIYEDHPEANFFYDYSLFTNDYSYTYYWGWKYMTTNYNSEILPIKNIYLKPELGLILLNNDLKEILLKKFFEEKIKENKCYELLYKTYYFYYCEKDTKINNFGKFEFLLKRQSMNITLECKDLFHEYNNYLFFMIVFTKNCQIQDIYLGYPFFKKYNTLFNIDTKNIGYYDIKINYNSIDTNNNNDNKRNNNDKGKKDDKNKNMMKYDNNNETIKIILAFGLILGILGIFYLIFYLYRGFKRKSKGKLFEELNS